MTKTKIKRDTITIVHMTDILDHIGYTLDEGRQIMDYGFDGISFGDAQFTVIGNHFALECLLAGNRNLSTPRGTDDVAGKYWAIVRDNDFINLEGMY